MCYEIRQRDEHTSACRTLKRRSSIVEATHGRSQAQGTQAQATQAQETHAQGVY